MLSLLFLILILAALVGVFSIQVIDTCISDISSGIKTEQCTRSYVWKWT